jgi:hypothetical protein
MFCGMWCCVPVLVFPTFQRNVLPSFTNVKASKKTTNSSKRLELLIQEHVVTFQNTKSPSCLLLRQAALCLYGYCVIRRSLSRLIHHTFGQLQRQKCLMFIYPIYNNNWRNISTIYIYIYIYIYI